MATGSSDIKLSGVEVEVTFLKAVLEQVDLMVNFAMMSIGGSDHHSEIRFETSTHQRLFNVFLVDFLSAAAKDGPTAPVPYLAALRAIIETPHFDVDDSVNALRQATRECVAWLEDEVEVDVWLPSISTDTTLKILRVRFLKMCGNISKHNFLRSVRVAKQLQEALAASGVTKSLEESLLALQDFYERFHSDILNYHSSTIAEFLNNIRWGIYEYMHPEYRRSVVHEGGDPPRYHFEYPIGLTSAFAQSCYWDLMNDVRRPPYMKRFRVTKYLKMRY